MDLLKLERAFTHSSLVRSVFFTADSAFLVTGDFANAINVYSCTQNFTLVQEVDKAHDNTVASSALTPTQLLSGSCGVKP
jgi:WD40 repeat protein